MTVALDSYVQQPASRIPVPTTITNVIAMLQGDQPESTGRTYVVSGHYDSMCTSPTNATCDAPGADDDASGVIAVLEMARAMATRHFDATIVFMAVAGEEQGLYGSTHFAQTAKQSGMDIQGMFTNDIIGASRSYSSGISRPRVVRLFAEGVPTSETPGQASTRQSVGGENDSPVRQLARYVEEVAENHDTGMDVQVIYRRDRYLRGGDHIPFLERGYAAARFTEPDETYEHQHQDVRVQDGVQYGDLPQYVGLRLHRPRRARERGRARVAGARARRAQERPHHHGEADQRHDAAVEREPGAGRRRLRDRLAQHRRAALDAHDPGRQRDRVHGQGHVEGHFCFGVRAIDRDGHRSPVAFPVPASR
jgi:hypothetical protein